VLLTVEGNDYKHYASVSANGETIFLVYNDKTGSTVMETLLWKDVSYETTETDLLDKTRSVEAIQDAYDGESLLLLTEDHCAYVLSNATIQGLGCYDRATYEFTESQIAANGKVVVLLGHTEEDGFCLTVLRQNNQGWEMDRQLNLKGQCGGDNVFLSVSEDASAMVIDLVDSRWLICEHKAPLALDVRDWGSISRGGSTLSMFRVHDESELHLWMLKIEC